MDGVVLAGIVGALCSVIIAALALNGWMNERRQRHDAERKAQLLESAAVARIIPWFDENREQQSLPSMVKQIAADTTEFKGRLDRHLVDEEDKVDRLTAAIEDLRTALNDGDGQRAEIMRQLAAGNPEIRRDPSP